MDNRNPPPFGAIALGAVTPMAHERETAERFVREVREQCASFPFRTMTHFAIFDRITDGTADLLHGYRAQIPHLEVIFQPESGFALFTRKALQAILARGIRLKGQLSV